MINKIFSSIDRCIGVLLFVDDGALWKRGRNIDFITNTIQESIRKLEIWALEWVFRFSVAKTEAVLFTKRKIQALISLKLYGENRKCRVL